MGMGVAMCAHVSTKTAEQMQANKLLPAAVGTL